MPCKINLHRSFNRLDETEKYGQHEYDDGDPKGIPLWASAAIVPPLRQRSRFGFVKNLLQDGQTLTPEMKLVDLPALDTEEWTLDRATVQAVQLPLLLIPLSNTPIS
jgi:hypothetical protein